MSLLPPAAPCAKAGVIINPSPVAGPAAPGRAFSPWFSAAEIGADYTGRLTNCNAGSAAGANAVSRLALGVLTLGPGAG